MCPKRSIAARQMSPLVIGLGQGENFCASDVPAILNATRRVIFLDDGEMAILTRDDSVQVVRHRRRQDAPQGRRENRLVARSRPKKAATRTSCSRKSTSSPMS